MASKGITRRPGRVAWCGVGLVFAGLLLCCKSDKSSNSDDVPSAARVVARAPVEDATTSDHAPVNSTAPLLCAATLEGVRTASIKVTSVHDKSIASFVAWAYLYNDGAHVGRVRVEGANPVAAGKTTSVRADLPEMEVDTVECEIGELAFVGGAQWRNDNVVYANADTRPLGGEPAALGAVPVVVQWSGTIADPGHFKLINQSARSLLVARAGIFFLDAEGSIIKRSIANVQTELSASATLELGLGIRTERIPKGTDSIRVFVSEASYLDGERAKWRDLNRERSLPTD